MIGWGKRIADARDAVGLSQTRFGERVGAAQGTVSGWETEAAEPTLQQFQKIAEVTGFNVCWIAFKTGQPRPDSASLDNMPLDRKTIRNVVFAIAEVLHETGLSWPPDIMAKNTIAFHDMFEGDDLEDIVSGVRAHYKRAKKKQK
jgi:HTH-type transcriptional regulator, cell division transcriptional repressor